MFRNLLPLLLLTLTLAIFSCQRDGYYEGGDIQVSFSQDTLRFDTVFTSIGSSTRWIKVFNPKDQPIKVDVHLKNISNTHFRINADGFKGPLIKDVEINSKDSIYIFVEVTVDPNQPLSASPFVIEDQIEVTANRNTFTAYLEAWGQNANYIPSNNAKGQSSILTCGNGTVVWDDPKPYVVYGILYIDSCTLKLPKATKIYVHGGVVRDENSIYNDGLIVVLKNGKIQSEGTAEEPVTFQGDRLEQEYLEVKSQWVGILFWHESKQNILKYTNIRNSTVGVRADSLAELSLIGCKITNTSGPGIIGRHATIYGENCLLYGNSTYGMQLTFGGDYDFNYCTVGSYEGQNESVILTDFYCEDIFCSTGVKINKLNANFTNCIFVGSDIDEIGLSQASQDDSQFNYKFTNCIIKVKDLLLPKNVPNFLENCENCIQLKNTDKLFLKRNDDDYRLDTMSIALGKAKFIDHVSNDILNRVRKSNPDIGCYEL